MNLTVRVALLFFRNLCATDLEHTNALWETVSDCTLYMISCTTAAPHRALILWWPNIVVQERHGYAVCSSGFFVLLLPVVTQQPPSL
uniref:Secreted protein n=1 Tax=Arundo donax TaxID=35708 RepID=A0A0A9A269_ARUDO